MSRLTAVLVSSLLTLLLVFAAAFVLLRSSAGGFSAREQPMRLEAWVARHTRQASMPAAMRERRNPVAITPEALHDGMAHYADHCAVCHANNGSGDTMLGRGMYPKPPDMRQALTQNRTDGELFSIIENGIRMSGMPAFGGSGDADSERDSWKLVLFLRHLPKLTPAEEQEMQHLNPKGPDEIEEERQEEEFLHGAEPAVPVSKK